MSDSNAISLNTPEQNASLQTVFQGGARQLLKQAIEAELANLLEQPNSTTAEDGKLAVVRNGYLPKRTIQTGLGDIPVKVPKVRDRTGSGFKFNRERVPPYLKRTKNVEEFLPWLYMRGTSRGDFSPRCYTTS